MVSRKVLWKKEWKKVSCLSELAHPYSEITGEVKVSSIKSGTTKTTVSRPIPTFILARDKKLLLRDTQHK